MVVKNRADFLGSDVEGVNGIDRILPQVAFFINL